MERSAKEHLPAERPADKGTADEGTPDKARAAEAADLIELNGDDLRRDPLEVRKATLTSLLSEARPGIRDIEADGPTVFAHACRMALEGIVSKRRDSSYRSGRSRDWLKSKNPASAEGPPRGTPGGPLMHRDDTPTLTKPIAESEEVNRLFQQFLLRLRNRPSRRNYR